MEKEEDVKKQLEVKNKEIYLNKLNLDIDNNMEVLILAIDNLLNSIPDTVNLKILEINESFTNKEEITKQIQIFVNSYQGKLMNLINSKSKYLKYNLDLIANIDVFKIKLNENLNSFKEELSEYSKELIELLENSIKKYIKEEFKNKRLNSYLNEIFITNLNEKVLDIVKTRDTILINTFKETYSKYLELNKNTVGEI